MSALCVPPTPRPPGSSPTVWTGPGSSSVSSAPALTRGPAAVPVTVLCLLSHLRRFSGPGCLSHSLASWLLAPPPPRLPHGLLPSGTPRSLLGQEHQPFPGDLLDPPPSTWPAVALGTENFSLFFF
uniref:Uncharacterized protein n=1 Tax=Molossus molossus TaxID=27622 RepID=A0A7J8ERJ4_MOLMO|nr:hypothetical protein HJG59_008784 [Molossus molossus]